jgi:hypothetical protein
MKTAEPKIPLNVHPGFAEAGRRGRRRYRRSDPDGLGKPHAQCRPARDGWSKTHRAAEPLVKDRQTLKMRFLPQGREMDAKQAGRNFAPFNSLSPVCGEAVC